MDFCVLEGRIESIDQIKCTSCKNYLSYFPIMASQDEIICGRCPPKEGFIRIVPYEILAQFMRFPCRYQLQGCHEELLPGEIPHHEEKCKFRVFPCPMPEPVACEWEGPRIDLLRHCLDLHSDLVLEKSGEFELDLTRLSTCHNVVEFKNVLLFFERKYDPDEQLLKFALYRSQYDLGTEPFSYHLEIDDEDLSLSVNLTTLTSQEQDYDLKEISLSYLQKDDKTIALGQLVIGEASTQVAGEMLSILKYSKCSEYAIPPIYHCSEKGNVVCHSAHVYSNGTTFSQDFKLSLGFYETLSFANRIFLLRYKRSRPYYYFTVETIGACEDNFKFQIEILDPTKSGMTMVSRKMCGARSKYFSFTNNLNNYCLFTNISNFEKDNCIQFKVTILP